jgi:L-rhamnose mutarotase
MAKIRRFGQHAKLKPDMVEEYDRLHAAVWPDVLKMIGECNLENYSIYRDGEDLFSYFEYTGNDYEADMKKMEADSITRSWWTHTHPCFLHSDVFYSDMIEIFHID